jgi:hypothetical protein
VFKRKAEREEQMGWRQVLVRQRNDEGLPKAKAGDDFFLTIYLNRTFFKHKHTSSSSLHCPLPHTKMAVVPKRFGIKYGKEGTTPILAMEYGTGEVLFCFTNAFFHT